MNAGFITSWSDFVHANELVVRDLVTHKALPDLVVRDRFQRVSFDECDWVFGANFWAEVRKIAKAAGDSDILVGVLDPDPKEYFHANFGYFPWFWMSCDCEPTDYWNALNVAPEASTGDCTLGVAETIVFTGRSGRWVIFGDRSREILVLGTTDQMEGKGIGWNDLDWAIERFKLVFGESPITGSFCERLEQAYSGSMLVADEQP